MKTLFKCAANLLLGITILLFPSEIQAQLTSLDPASWEGFVSSNANYTARDTFMMQTFTNSPTDNWGYTIVRNAELFQPSDYGIHDGSGGLALKLSGNSEVRFDHFDNQKYKLVYLIMPYAVHQLMTGEDLHLTASRSGIPEYHYKWMETSDDYTVHFKETKNKGAVKRPYIILGNSLDYVWMNVNEATGNTKNGYYAIDSAYIWGEIGSYSLFKGNGSWEDKTKWSHNPAYRHRQALIKGNVSVSAHTQCQALYIGEGSVHIEEGSVLTVDTLFLNDVHASLFVSGEVVVNDRITIRKSFAEKGKWYFISFPFDVYAEGVDPYFSLGDEQTAGSGNLFYIRTYNGTKRSETNRDAGNWDVLSSSTVDNNKIVFEKGKGYLIALDSKATRQEMLFTSALGAGRTAFGQQEPIIIPATHSSSEGDVSNKGWYLCGNPLASPLSLSAMETNTAIDGYVYLYDGTTYEPYLIGSDYAIPALSAFFVKAKQRTELVLKDSRPYTEDILLAVPAMQSLTWSEPQTKKTTANALAFEEFHPKYHLTTEGIFITNLPSSAQFMIVDLTGRILCRQTLSGGDSFLPLTLQTGVYFLLLQTDRHQTQYKFVWDN